LIARGSSNFTYYSLVLDSLIAFLESDQDFDDYSKSKLNEEIRSKTLGCGLSG